MPPPNPKLYSDLPTDPEEIFSRILDRSGRDDDLARLYHQLRILAPVWRAPVDRLGRPWIITRFADADAIVRHPGLVKDERVLGLSGLGDGGMYIEVLQRMFAFQPPPRHTRMRALVNRGFSARSVNALEPRIQQVVDGLLDDLEPKGEMELVADFAFRVPVTVICQVLGAPIEDVPHISEWAATFGRRADEGEELTSEMERLGDESAASFVDYIKSLLAERRATPGDDLLTRLIEVQRDAPDLTDDDIAATSILLFQAGHETTANLISKGVLGLLRHPEEYARLSARPELAAQATEELLRYDTSVQLTTKFATQEIPFHDETIGVGDPVSFIWGAINRDPERFEEPDRLDIERANVAHFSFGMGEHYCLGASLARLEIQRAVSTLATRLPGLRLATENPEYKPQLHLHGLVSLPVTW